MLGLEWGSAAGVARVRAMAARGDHALLEAIHFVTNIYFVD